MTEQPQARSATTNRRRQQTLKHPINCSGIGLHSGAKVNMTLLPAAPDTGIVFRRTDVPTAVGRIPARWDMVSDTVMCTTIANRHGVKVATIEHLMAALAGSGVDNLLIELDGLEVPVMDGSSAPFVFLIECAGLQAQPTFGRSIRVLKHVEVAEGGRSASLTPSSGFSVSFEIDFDSPVVAHKTGFFDLHDGSFKRDIARARTFGFERDVQKLWQLGLARGGSLDNAVVIGSDHRVLNEGGLRYADEFVRHKVLDAIGDLALVGAPLLGHFHGVRSGHELNNRLLRKLLEDASAWDHTEASPRSLAREDLEDYPPMAATA